LSRIRNADEFRLKFREIRGKYERIFGPRIAEIRRKYASGPERDLIDRNLEMHARVYIVNALLAALNWRMDSFPEDGLPNLIPEAPVRSADRKSIRFFDYLGLENETDAPLLIVETKRPDTPLPQAQTPAATYSEVLARGLRGKPLKKKEWNDWLEDLGDYVRSAYEGTQRIPRRVVITNGDWLILFLDPSDAFLEDGDPDPNRILVFTSRDDIERRCTEIFRHLEHQNVLGETPLHELEPAQIPFYLNPEEIDQVMHGLHLLYIEQPKIYGDKDPVIKVVPIIFLRSRYGAWFRVENRLNENEYELPHDSNALAKHFKEVEQAAKGLLDEVNRYLKNPRQPTFLSEHYEDEGNFETLPGVIEIGHDEFLVVTGNRTHYLLPEPMIPKCPFHDWMKCKQQGVPSDPGPILSRSTSPRSFFVSGEIYHCAHRDVSSAKASRITTANREQCGLRSGQEGQAFCEIWRFEQYLCCRACVFGEVCIKAPAFRLPCDKDNWFEKEKL